MLEIKKDLPLISIPQDFEKEVWIYDIETYPNFFFACFWNGVKFFEFVCDTRHLLFKAIQDKILVGFNSLSFDDCVLKCIMLNMQHLDQVTDQFVYDCAQNIIKADDADWIKKITWKTKIPWYRSIDLMKIAFCDDVTGRGKAGLKDIAIRMKWNKIQDLPYPFTRHLSEQEKRHVVDYCRNDVMITAQLYKELYKEIMLRKGLEDEYKVNVLSKSDAQVCETIFIQLYSRKTRTETWDLKKLSVMPPKIEIGKMISDKIVFCDPILKEHLDKWKRTTIYKQGGKYNKDVLKETIDFGNVQFSMGAGGIHTNDIACIQESCEKYIIIDADVTSFYPFIILTLGLKPEHLKGVWLDILREITEKRLEAKKKGQEIIQRALKIVILSAFGKAADRYSFMFDPKLLFSVTLNGQLLLLMLCEMLHKSGFEILSANTDGVTCKIERSRMPEFKTVCEVWENDTDLNLEYEEFRKIVKTDVNNYIAFQAGDDRKPKRKGRSFAVKDLKGKNDATVIKKALINYFGSNIAIEDTIKQEKDILNFCYSFKSNKQFKVLHRGVELQKTNRWFTSKDGKSIVKKRVPACQKCHTFLTGINVCGECNSRYNDIKQKHCVNVVCVEKTQIPPKLVHFGYCPNCKRDYSIVGKVGAIISISTAYQSQLLNDIPQECDIDKMNIDYNDYILEAKKTIFKITAFQKAVELRDAGLHPCPKEEKHNTTGFKNKEVKFNWNWGKKAGVGIYTGIFAKIIALDLDYPEKISQQIFDLLLPSFTIWNGEGSERAVITGKKKGCILYYTANEYLKSSSGKFTEKNGFEVLFGRVPVQCFGLHTSGNEYHHAGTCVQLPVNLERKLLELLPKTKKKNNLEFDFDSILTEENKHLLIKVVQDVLPHWNYEIVEINDKFKLVGYCPYNNEHSRPSSSTDFDVLLIEDEDGIRCGCWHISCQSSRTELLEALNESFEEQKILQNKEDDLKQLDINYSAVLNNIQEQMDDNEVLEDIKQALNSRKKNLIVQASTGSGKTHESAIFYLECIKQNIPIAYVASNRSDQDQFVDLIEALAEREYTELYTTLLHGGQYFEDEVDQNGKVKIQKSSIGVITHHTYLQRKGFSHLFYSFLNWVKNHQPILLIDEADNFLESLSHLIQIGARYKMKHYPSMNFVKYQKLASCPAFDKSGNCGNCHYKCAMTYESNQFYIPIIRIAGEIRGDDWSKSTELEIHPPYTTATNYVKNIKIENIEQHKTMLQNMHFAFRLQDGEMYDFAKALSLIIDSSYNPCIYREQPMLKSEPIHPTHINESNKKEVKFPYQTCNVPHLSLKDAAPLEWLRRHARKTRWLSATITPSNIQFLQYVFQTIETIKIDKVGQKIDELLIIGYKKKINFVKTKQRKTYVFFDYFNSFGKVLCFEPTKKKAKRLYEKLPRRNYPAGVYIDDSLHINEKFSEGEHLVVISYSRGPIGRAINLPKFNTVICYGKVFKPSIAYNLLESTVEELEIRKEEDCLTTIQQNVGRIIRGNKGRKLIIVHGCSEKEIAALKDDLQKLVRSEVNAEFFDYDEESLINCAKKYLHSGEVDNQEVTVEEMIEDGGLASLSKNDRTDEVKEKLQETRKKKKIDNLFEMAMDFKGTWREFYVNKNLSRIKKDEKITQDDIDKLKVLIEGIED